MRSDVSVAGRHHVIIVDDGDSTGSKRKRKMPSAHSHLPHGLRFDTKDDDFQEDSSIKKRMKPHTTRKEVLILSSPLFCAI